MSDRETRKEPGRTEGQSEKRPSHTMDRLMAKTSTIFIATGDETRVYRSVREVPATLRKKLQQSTNGINSATILIADRRGREELTRALQGVPSNVHSRLAGTIRRHSTFEDSKPPRWRTVAFWLELLLPVAAGASLWFLISPRP